MRKFFAVLAGVLALAAVGSANALPCGVAPILFTTLISQGGCEAGDKIFTNFVITSGTVDPNVTATIQIAGLQSQSVLLNLNDGNGFTANFQLTYNVAVDPLVFPASLDPLFYKIVLASAGLQDNGGGDTATWTKAVVASSGTGSGSQTVTDVNGSTNNGQSITGLSAFALDVTDTFSQTVANGAIIDLSNRFVQADTIGPEPSTMMLMGFALVGLGVAGRKRIKKG